MAQATPGNTRTLYRRVLHASRTLHTYLSMLAVLLFGFFGLTGFMLNHAEWFGLDATRSNTTEHTLPPDTLAGDKLALVEHLRWQAGVVGAVQPFDWPGEGEVFHLSFKSPTTFTDVDIDPQARLAVVATETRGLAGTLTRLHTAREAGAAWQLILDGAALLLLAASVTGLLLWQSLPKRRTIGLAALGTSAALVGAVYVWLVP